jgi:hypothetical protein
MAHGIGNRVKQTTTTTGTGTLSLVAPDIGFVSFVDGIGNGYTADYVIDNGAGEWEVGRGTITSGSPDTLSRTTIFASSNAGSAVNFSAGTKTVAGIIPASKIWTVDNYVDDVTLMDGASVEVDIQLPRRHFTLTATGNRTLAAPTNATNNQIWILKHKASGADRTLSLTTGAGGFSFGTDIAALTATTSGLTDYITFQYNSTSNRHHVIGYSKGYNT